MDSRSRWRWVLVSTGVGSFVTAANLSTVNIAFPAIRSAFEDSSLAAVGWVVNAYTIAFAAVLLPAGRLADCYGRRRVFFWGLGLFSVGSLLSGTGPDLALVVAGRMVQGVGSALIVPSALGLLLEASLPQERTRAVALYGGITAVGVATGPTLGALVVEAAGWRWSFLVSPPFALAAWLAGRGPLSRARGADEGQIDLTGVALATVAMAGVALGIAEGREWGWASPEIVGAFAIGLVGALWFLRRCRRHPTPVLPLDLFGIRSFTLSAGATTLFGAAVGAVLLANVLFLTSIWGYSTLGAGLAMAPSPIVAALAAPLVGRLGSQFGVRAVSMAGASVFTFGTLWYRFRAGVEPNYWLDWFPGAVVSGLGINMAFPMLQAAAVRDVAPSRFSLANGSTRAALQLGTAIGVALLVAILGDRTHALGDFRAVWLMIAVFGGGTALLAGAIDPRRPAAGRPAEAAVASP